MFFQFLSVLQGLPKVVRRWNSAIAIAMNNFARSELLPRSSRRSAGTEAPALRDGKLVLEESRGVQLSCIAAGSGTRVIAQ